MERLKNSIRLNLVFYLIVGSISLLGLILLVTLHRNWNDGVLGFAMACSNTFGLVTGAFLLGFGLSEIPKSIWRNADWTTRHRVLSHKIAKMAVILDDAHLLFSNSIVVAQSTSKQNSKREPLRPYMAVIDNMLVQMFKQDPSFKPHGARLRENDVDYDTDEKSMARLRCCLRGYGEQYYNCKRKYVSCFRSERTGTFGSFLDKIELIWRCILWKQFDRVLAIILGCMSAAILLAEATMLPRGVDLSLISVLINSAGNQEVFVQVFAFVPLVYMCVCVYYSLFEVGMLKFYSLTPRQTSSVRLLMIGSMVARYAPPISYNFLNLISLHGNKKTIFEKGMRNIDDAAPFFGKRFNKIYPLMMVVYTLLVVSNSFNCVVNVFGNWEMNRLQTEADDMDSFDPSGLLILERERNLLGQGRRVGEHFIQLARNFNSDVDLQSAANDRHRNDVEINTTSDLAKEDLQGSSEYDAVREQNKQASNMMPAEDIASAKVSLLEEGSSQSGSSTGVQSGLASGWASMKAHFLNFKANIGAKKFIPLHQVQETNTSTLVSSSESPDEKFHRLKKPAAAHGNNIEEVKIELISGLRA